MPDRRSGSGRSPVIHAAAAKVIALGTLIALNALLAIALPSSDTAATETDATAGGFVNPPRLWWQEVRQGDGQVSTRRHPLFSSSALVLRLPFPVEIHCGVAPDSAGITVDLDANLQELVTVEEKDGRVEIGLSDACRSDLAARVVIELQELTALDVHGPGPTAVRAVAGDRLEITQVGAAEVTVQGAAERFILTIYGSGGVAAAELTARVAAVQIMGAGSARVAVRDSLAARLYGSGDLDCIIAPDHIDLRRFGRGAFHRP